MTLDVFNVSFLVAYFIVILIISYFSFRKETPEGYLIADRRVSWYALSASISAGFVGGGFVAGIMTWSFLFGFSVMWIILGMPIGFLLLALISKKLKSLSDKNRFYTLSDYIYFKFGRKSGLLSSVIIFIYFFGWLVLQFVVGGIVFSSITGLSYILSLLIIGIIILIYLVMAGFKAMIRTDIFQFFLIIILVISIIGIFSSGVTIEPSQLNLLEGTGGPLYIIGFLFIGIFVTMVSGDVWQRAYSSKNVKNLRLGFIGAALIMLIVGTIITLFGIIVKANFPGIGAEDAIVYGFNQLLPPYLLWIGLLILMSSIMSTADTVLFSLSMNVSRDFASKFRRLDESQLVKLSRISLILIAVISISVASLTTDVSNIYLWISIHILAIAPPVLLSFIHRINNNAAFVSILLGFISFLVLNTLGAVSFETAVIPFSVSLVSVLILPAFLRTK